MRHGTLSCATALAILQAARRKRPWLPDDTAPCYIRSRDGDRGNMRQASSLPRRRLRSTLRDRARPGATDPHIPNVVSICRGRAPSLRSGVCVSTVSIVSGLPGYLAERGCRGPQTVLTVLTEFSTYHVPQLNLRSVLNTDWKRRRRPPERARTLWPARLSHEQSSHSSLTSLKIGGFAGHIQAHDVPPFSYRLLGSIAGVDRERLHQLWLDLAGLARFPAKVLPRSGS